MVTQFTKIAPLTAAWLKPLKALLWLSILALTQMACTSSLVVESDFPAPLTKPINVNMGVVYSKELTQYVYKEESDSRDRWIIDMGEAHKNLFQQIFSKLVAQTAHLKSLDDAKESNLELVLVPSIQEFQYSSPRETKVSIYEVWIKYHMQVFETDGTLVADWIMSAYGKTPSAFLKSNEEAMNQAVIVALRDLGASLTTGFAKVPELKAWLDQHNKPKTSPEISLYVR